jgi:hypothetical protein
LSVELPLTELLKYMAAFGCTSLLCKPLARNDNTKNQIYLGPDFSVLNVLPHENIVQEGVGDKGNLKAKLNLFWINEELKHSQAAGAQLILYPQYPEVRLSGFLRGCSTAPSSLMRSRSDGYAIPNRMLLIGVNTSETKLYGFVSAEHDRIFNELSVAIKSRNPQGIFFDITDLLPSADSLSALVEKLQTIASRGWIRSKKLHADGSVMPCEALNCGGYTLEAELGIRPNSKSDPDFLGWEVKQHGVSRLDDLPTRLLQKGKPITLMTPEPKGGLYIELGAEKFIRRFGYKDRTGRVGRLNFGGKYTCLKPYPLTGLMLRLDGFDLQSGKWLPDGQVALVASGETEPAASWPFAELLDHWGRKHAKAVYVPSIVMREPELRYQFGTYVRLGEGPDFTYFLKALALGIIFYDPGIKLEQAEGKWKPPKRRSQFRVISGDLPKLYKSMTVRALL